MMLLKIGDFKKVNINFWKQSKNLNSLFDIEKLSLSEPKISHQLVQCQDGPAASVKVTRAGCWVLKGSPEVSEWKACQEVLQS